MSSRAERKAAAEVRRTEWRLRWVDVARKRVDAGGNMRDAVMAISGDAELLIRQHPQFKSDIEHALILFVRALAHVVVAVKEELAARPLPSASDGTIAEEGRQGNPV